MTQTTGPASPSAKPPLEAAVEAVLPPTPPLAEVDGIVKTYVIAAMGLGLVPVPVFDMVAIIAVQLRLTQKLSQAYGVKYSENAAKSVILSLIGGVLPAAATAATASALKFIPGIGLFVGVAGVSVFSGALTYAIGKILIQHYESGGTLLDFDPSRVRDRFRAELKAGRAAAASAKAEGKAAA